ncbi:MAG: dTDP-4-dehydrorhamnose 3,5-epimerase family protein [Gemmatimonadetes bacterium]|jgi:dTDP-4-dehydrorhamnose 3,5-epimerase|nr:dTDP-4-dehydrorhamnose 3,5-epimerase family protein [Gemmatimonadota bacterium]MBT5059883.1 dTDP-4-dehydrorhamnose 3,5-epimerase family protein [Gemmatimonadota bacterium]MBT5144414.1 dTDP-4-dehydrorhamnose 3,5-epimerase family protein [Gemmatimonadota bacterium]MBT5587068.1 dTDP-4-dehydrorhamnose 3,5-epimerase family protein [Gemmatimonadota bacterium]MBT5960336.1 dTDP-4-dehydrorhamnose 3,5-epimerase family protein [Gemmatimonadota bacterium]
MAGVESQVIADVLTLDLAVFGDDRGRFSEMFRDEWFPQRAWKNVQVNRSHSVANTLRGLHYHHKQADYWHVLAGTLRVGLYDLRPWSKTHRASQTIDVSGEDFTGIFIPPGIAHGFYAVTDVTLIYVVDNYYDGADELGVAWNDPALGLDWKVPSVPIVSERDTENPMLIDLPADQLPRGS